MIDTVSGADWLDEIHRHYDRQMITPVYAAAEILLGQTDPEGMAAAINRRGCRVGDNVMATTTAADCADAVQELISLGFLAEVFSAPSPADDQAEEAVLELRLP